MTDNVMMRSSIRYAAELPESATDADAAIEWCLQQYGEPGFTDRWMCLAFTVQFRDKRDRDWYILRWGV